MGGSSSDGEDKAGQLAGGISSSRAEAWVVSGRMRRRGLGGRRLFSKGESEKGLSGSSREQKEAVDLRFRKAQKKTTQRRRMRLRLERPDNDELESKWISDRVHNCEYSSLALVAGSENEKGPAALGPKWEFQLTVLGTCLFREGVSCDVSVSRVSIYGTLCAGNLEVWKRNGETADSIKGGNLGREARDTGEGGGKLVLSHLLSEMHRPVLSVNYATYLCIT